MSKIDEWNNLTDEEKRKPENEKLMDEALEEMFSDDENSGNNENNGNESFDDIMNEILGEEEVPQAKSKDEFEKMMEEVAVDRSVSEPENSIEEIDNTIEYKFTGDTHLQLFNGYVFDTGFGDGYRERTVIKTSDLLEIDGTFNTSEIVLEKRVDKNKLGKIVFKEKQKADDIIIENVGVKGHLDAAIVSIHDTSYVDIYLDITDKRKCAYLLIDYRFDRVRGNITMNKDFYNQLTDQNKHYLMQVSLRSAVNIKEGGNGIHIYVDGRELYDLYDPKPGEMPTIEKEYDELKEILINIGVES